jgi:hypothetical protein
VPESNSILQDYKETKGNSEEKALWEAETLSTLMCHTVPAILQMEPATWSAHTIS